MLQGTEAFMIINGYLTEVENEIPLSMLTDFYQWTDHRYDEILNNTDEILKNMDEQNNWEGFKTCMENYKTKMIGLITEFKAKNGIEEVDSFLQMLGEQNEA